MKELCELCGEKLDKCTCNDEDSMFFPDEEINIDDVKEIEISIDDLLPNKKNDIKETNDVKMKINEFEELITNIPDIELDFESEWRQRVDAFEQNVWDPNQMGFKLKDEKMDKALNGLQAGLHIIAGSSNHGKSALLTDIEIGLLENNDNIYILSFSLDDTYEEKFSRITALMNNVNINFIRNPLKYGMEKSLDDDWYIKWKNSVTKAKTLSSKYNIYDGAFTSDIDEIEKKIIETQTILEEYKLKTGIEKRLVVVIDSFHDLTTSIDKLNKNHEAKFEYIARQVRSWHAKYNIPMICTAELKKLNAHRRPILDDVRDASKIVYVAKNIMLVYNEVSQKSEGAQVFYNIPGEPNKKPVLEVAFAKNKFTEFKGRLYYLFKPESVSLVPANKESELKWNSKVYG